MLTYIVGGKGAKVRKIVLKNIVDKKIYLFIMGQWGWNH